MLARRTAAACVDCVGYDVAWSALDQPLVSSQVKIHLDLEKYSVQASESDQPAVQEAWNMCKQANPRLFNGQKFRLARCSLGQQNGTLLELGVGLSDYATFLGTNRNPDEALVERLKGEGLARFGDEDALFAMPLGNAALMITADGLVPLFLRSSHTSEFAGWWATPGGEFRGCTACRWTNSRSGHAEPSRLGDSMTPDAVAKEIFFAVKDEVRTELNIPLSNIIEQDAGLIGIIREHASRNRPTSVL